MWVSSPWAASNQSSSSWCSLILLDCDTIWLQIASEPLDEGSVFKTCPPTPTHTLTSDARANPVLFSLCFWPTGSHRSSLDPIHLLEWQIPFSGFLWRIWQGAYEEECRRGWMGRGGSLQAIWVHRSVWVSVCSSPWKHSGPYLLDFFLEISFLIDGKGKCSNGGLFRFLGLSSSRVWGKTPLERSRPYDWLSEFLCLVKELRDKNHGWNSK